MYSVTDLLRLEGAYLRPPAETGNPDALADVQKMIGPAFADAREFAARRETIASNRNLSPSGRDAELAKLEAERQSSWSNHEPVLLAAQADKETEAQHLRKAMDLGMEPHGA